MCENQETALHFRYTWPLNNEVKGIASRLVSQTYALEIEGQHIDISMPDARNIQSVVTMPYNFDLAADVKRVGLKGEELKQPSREQLRSVHALLVDAASRFLRVVKFYLDNPQISESALANFPRWEWSLTAQRCWELCPMQITSGTANVLIIPGYQGDLCHRVSEAIAKDEPPVLIHAMRHLHRAKQERDPRHRWIDATIAAELGIKEFLLKYKSDLKALLFEIPSPPLHKLYGTVLESYAGQRSPKLNEIRKGVERRNQLIHKPVKEDVTDEEAKKYVRDIEVALLHLTTLLYPEDDLAQYYYDIVEKVI